MIIIRFFKNYFRGWNWFEYTLLVLVFTVPVTLGLIFKSGIIEILTSIFFVSSYLMFAKAKVETYYIAFFAYVGYIWLSWSAGLYGEIITTVVLSFPIAVWAAVSWSRNKQSDHHKGRVIVINSVRLPELGLLVLSQLVMGIGYFFLLQALSTQFVIISTITLAIRVMGNYLDARRNILAPFAYLTYSVFAIILWSLVFASGMSGAIVIIAMQCLIMVIDIYASVSWIKLKKRQPVAYAVNRIVQPAN